MPYLRNLVNVYSMEEGREERGKKKEGKEKGRKKGRERRKLRNLWMPLGNKVIL